jgi:outer membrane protein assembly factor BamD
MKRSLFVLVGLLVFAAQSPAPLIYRPDEGWAYETPGTDTGKWQRARAKDQLEVAEQAFEKKDYDLALKAAGRVIKVWPLSDYAPRASYLVGRCYEAKHQDEKAFNAYQRIIEKNPKVENYEEILSRQYEIANRYYAGQWFKIWNYIPFFPSMEKTAGMYEKIVKNAPYSEVAPQAQIKLGETREKRSEFREAVKAYERAADRYNDRPQVAADAYYKVGLAYRKQAKKAEYDQNAALQAVSSFTDFITLYPNDPRVPEARKIIDELKTEAARGSFNIAQFYEKQKKWRGALIYYNEVLVQDANSPHATTARERIDEIKRRLETSEDVLPQENAATKASRKTKPSEPESVGQPASPQPSIKPETHQ